MDLKFRHLEPSDAEREAVEGVLGGATSGWDGGTRDAARDGRSGYGGLPAASRRDLLLPAFHAVQDRVGWISEAALDHICQRLSVPPAEAWGVLTFYDLFATAPRAAAMLHLCDDLACRLAGSARLAAELERELGPAGGGTGAIGWEHSPCLGACERAPAVLCIRAGESRTARTIAPAHDLAELRAALDDPAETTEPGTSAARLAAARRAVPEAGASHHRLLARVGVADPTRLDDYLSHGGGVALARALELGPAGVIAEVVTSRLVGRGGAAFPTGRKWEAVAKATSPIRYLVCNADESEPGTFKDRVVMEEDPFALIEAMTIAGFAIGAEKGFIYLRGEYPLAESRLTNAITACRAAGRLGADVLGAGFTFDIELRRGAGAYICGEETALFESLEGYRGEPRSKPPFPVEVGLFGQPTVVNNVETLASVLRIVTEGGEAFAGGAAGMSTGTKLFCLSGRVRRPGLYEVPFGETLRQLLTRAGGVDGELQAILLGGAAGTFVGPGDLDVPLTFEGTRAIGATLGSGVVLVYREGDDLKDALERIAAFFRHESCGQCVPCRVGTVRQQELLVQLGASHNGDRKRTLGTYRELAQAMRDASICGLGQTAASAIESALERFDPYQLKDAR
jgi:NADH-quinone oxidoreductase subunit F